MTTKELKDRADAVALEDWRTYGFQSHKDLAACLLDFGSGLVLEEREACAKVADGHMIEERSASASYWNDCGRNDAAGEIAAAIRKRSSTI